MAKRKKKSGPKNVFAGTLNTGDLALSIIGEKQILIFPRAITLEAIEATGGLPVHGLFNQHNLPCPDCGSIDKEHYCADGIDDARYIVWDGGAFLIGRTVGNSNGQVMVAVPNLAKG